VRLWSVHPEHLDRAALVACWREALLAQAVLERTSGGYAHHPQLERFRAAADPLGALGGYLRALADEADRRGYRFDRRRIRAPHPAADDTPTDCILTVSTGQLALERAHLQAKLDTRDAAAAARLRAVDLRAHPSFTVVAGPAASWERARPAPVAGPDA